MNTTSALDKLKSAEMSRVRKKGIKNRAKKPGVIRRQQERVAMGCVFKEVEDLTEEEKVAICFIAGAPMKIEDSGDFGTVRISTARPVGIVKINGAFKVLIESEHDRSRGQTIRIPLSKRDRTA